MLNTVQALPNVGPVCMEPYSFVIAWHNDYENTLASAPDNTIMLFLVGLSPTYQALPGNPPPHLQRDNVITAYEASHDGQISLHRLGSNRIHSKPLSLLAYAT